MEPKEVQTIRNQAGLSQTGLAALLGISDIRTIRRWETGDCKVSGPATIVLEMLSSGELPARYMAKEMK